MQKKKSLEVGIMEEEVGVEEVDLGVEGEEEGQVGGIGLAEIEIEERDLRGEDPSAHLLGEMKAGKLQEGISVKLTKEGRRGGSMGASESQIGGDSLQLAGRSVATGSLVTDLRGGRLMEGQMREGMAMVGAEIVGGKVTVAKMKEGGQVRGEIVMVGGRRGRTARWSVMAAETLCCTGKGLLLMVVQVLDIVQALL